MGTRKKGLSEPLADPSDAIVDIVFVHGLNGDREATWTHADETFWPQDLLPADLPTARIFTFGYRATIIEFGGGDPTQSRIDNHADDLLSALAALRTCTQPTERPIILVAHSLGGLVCQQAVLSGNNMPEKDSKEISQRIRGILFLGTPHEGAEMAKWADCLRRFCDYFRETNRELLKDLQKGSEKLAMLGKEFPKLLLQRRDTENAIFVTCFYEARDMQRHSFKFGKVVPEKSASLAGYPNHSIYADHSSMCKFAKDGDENYPKVRDTLQRWVRAFQVPIEPEQATYVANTRFTGTFYAGRQIGQMTAGRLEGDHVTFNINALPN